MSLHNWADAQEQNKGLPTTLLYQRYQNYKHLSEMRSSAGKFLTLQPILACAVYNVCQKSLEHPYSVTNFPSPSYFRCRNDNCEPPSYNVESIAEALSYLERHHFSFQCYSYQLQTTLLYGGGDFVVRLQHTLQEVFRDFWQKL